MYSGQPNAKEQLIAYIIATILCGGFGAIHCIAWRFHFPTHSEQLIWWIASLVITASPIFWLSIPAFDRFESFSNPYLTCIWESAVFFVTFLTIISFFLYLVARALLIVVAFTSLRSLPACAFETVPWTRYIPHWHSS